MPNKTALFTSGTVARQLDLPRWQLLYLIERGQLPGPTFEVPGRKLFTEQDVEQIRKSLAAPADPTHGAVEGE